MPNATSDNPSNGFLAMSLTHSQPNPTNTVDRTYAYNHMWRGGLIAITLRNVTQSEIVYVIDSFVDEDYLFEVFDSGGKPVPLTPAGERARFAFYHPRKVAFSGGRVSLLPAEDYTTSVDLARWLQIHPGERYTVMVRRSRGLPEKHESGKAIETVELSTTYVFTSDESQ